MKLIDFLLRLYPEEFRARFGRGMRAFHQERAGESDRAPVRVIADHLFSAAREQVRALRPDVSYALRGIRRRPGFAAVVVLSVALGVGANAAIYSVARGVLLRPLPYPHAERVITIGHEPPYWLVSEPQYAEYRTHLRSSESIAAYTTSEGNLALSAEPERVALASVSREFFETLGSTPALGRLFAAGEDAVRPANVVLLSHGIWQRGFSGDSAIIGRSVMLNGVSRTVVGVMPAGFEYPSRETALWLPICSQRTCTSLSSIQPDTLDGWANHYLWVIGRLREGVSVDRGRAEARSIAQRIAREHPENFNPASPLTATVASLRDSMVGTTRPYILALLGAVGVLLLIVCANIANLLLARGEARRREMALRTAIGASRRRLTTQLLTESVVLAIVGGALGLALAWAGTRALVAAAPASLPRVEQIGVDWSVAAFALLVSVVAGILFGVLPAIRASADAPADALKSAGKGAAHHAGTSRRARRVLVIAEVAVAMVLLCGAGMLVRSLVNLQNSNLGFEPSGALTLRVSPNARDYNEARTVQFYAQLLERVRAIPGVQSAGGARWLPVVDAGGMWDVRIEGRPLTTGPMPAAVPQDVTPGYFRAMGMRLLAGRDFTEADGENAPLVGIVSRAFARAFWNDENVIGRRFRLGARDSGWVSVIGVVEDIRARGHADTPEPTMYMAHAQTARSSYYVSRSMVLVLRTSGDPMRYAAAVRRATASLDPAAPVSRVRTLDAIAGSAIANRRFSTGLIAGFALLALVLAGVGIFGLVSYTVSEQTFEIGVRMALGANGSRVMGEVVRDGALLALIGVGAGLVGSAALGAGIRSMLVGVPRIDTMTMAAVAIVLIAVALIAAMVPARRAANVQPTEVLRSGS